MKSINILLNSIEKVKKFVNVIATYDGEFDLASNRYVVDAKSIMGIFSLDLSSPLRLDVLDESQYQSILDQVKDFVVED